MITLRQAAERGHADHGWLQSAHSFSFADYFDPQHMGVGNLRVINEDRIAPGSGFGTHGHRDMEIVSYVLSGALGHRDSLGHGTTIGPGDVQRMSAGRGVQHSEFNHAPDTTTHFLQIWVRPSQQGLAPSYAQKRFEASAQRGRLVLLLSPDAREGSLSWHADASLWAGRFDGAEALVRPLAAGRLAYVHLVRGSLQVNGQVLAAGDALTLAQEPELRLSQGHDAEVLVFDLAPE